MSQGLEPALFDAAAPLRAKGIEVVIAVDPTKELSEDAERLLYRAGREALRNVLQHANAKRVGVSLAMTALSARLTVTDNGQGFAPDHRAERRAEGHLGLDVVESLVRDSGGRFSLGPGEEGGTRFEVEVPVR